MSDYGRMPNFDTHGFTWPGGPEYEPPQQPRCGSCNGFLPWEPDRRDTIEEKVECDGRADTYTVEREGVLLDILGPGSDTESWSPCGSTDGPHEPHTELVGFYERTWRRCPRCQTLCMGGE